MQNLHIILGQNFTAEIKWQSVVPVPYLFYCPKLEKLFKDFHNNLSFKLEMLSVEKDFWRGLVNKIKKGHTVFQLSVLALSWICTNTWIFS